jgi:hypothetical protein
MEHGSATLSALATLGSLPGYSWVSRPIYLGLYTGYLGLYRLYLYTGYRCIPVPQIEIVPKATRRHRCPWPDLTRYRTCEDFIVVGAVHEAGDVVSLGRRRRTRRTRRTRRRRTRRRRTRRRRGLK